MASSGNNGAYVLSTLHEPQSENGGPFSVWLGTLFQPITARVLCGFGPITATIESMDRPGRLQAGNAVKTGG